MGAMHRNTKYRICVFAILLCGRLASALPLSPQEEKTETPDTASIDTPVEEATTVHHALHSHEHDLASFKPTHSFQCGYIDTLNWTRRFCFTDEVEVKRYVASPPGAKGSGPRLLFVHLHLEVHKRLHGDPGSAGGDAEYQPACGDSLRIIFSSPRVLFSPLRVRHPACGQYRVGLILPRDSVAYGVEVRLMHVDGEGREDPPEALWPPVDMNQHLEDGPVVYNIDARIRGLLRAPEHYAYHPVVTEHGHAGIVPEAEITGSDLGMLDSAGRPHDHAFLSECMRQFNELPEHAWEAECKVLQAQTGHSAGLPLCNNGNHPGRWLQRDSIYPSFKGLHWKWQPFSCNYVLFTSEDLNRCLQARFKRRSLARMRYERPNRRTNLPQIKMLGESTMNAIYNQWDEKLSTQYFYWDDYVDQGDCADCDKAKPHHFDYVHNETHPPLLMRESHGLQMMLDHFLKDVMWSQGPNFQKWASGDAPRATDALVLLQAANDVQKDSMPAFAKQLHALIRALQKNQADPKKASFSNKTDLVWITAPSRQYKHQGGKPGQSVCYGPRNCSATGLEIFAHARVQRIQVPFRAANGVLWGSDRVFQPRFFDTVDRRTAANAFAVQAFKKAFPRAKVVDYRALTEPLPADFSFDGEHYHCPKGYHDERINVPWQCLNTANEVVSNILANVLCNAHMTHYANEKKPLPMRGDRSGAPAAPPAASEEAAATAGEEAEVLRDGAHDIAGPLDYPLLQRLEQVAEEEAQGEGESASEGLTTQMMDILKGLRGDAQKRGRIP